MRHNRIVSADVPEVILGGQDGGGHTACLLANAVAHVGVHTSSPPVRGKHVAMILIPDCLRARLIL